MPKVSVIAPVYKAEQYLHRCIDSILSQSFTDWEFILVDDGSPDGSGTICDVMYYFIPLVISSNTSASVIKDLYKDVNLEYLSPRE